MSWRHPDSAINDPKPPASSFNMEAVRRLCTHVVKLRDAPEGVLVLSGLSHVWKSQTCDPVLKGADGNVIGDLAASNPSTNRIMSALAQSSGSTTCPNLFGKNSDDESDDNDACVEILLVTPIYFAAVIPSSGTRVGVLMLSLLMVRVPEGIITDAAIALSVDASHPRPSSSPASSFRDISGDAIHRDFFLFCYGPYNATYPKGGVAGNCEFDHEEWNASHQPTLSVLTKEVLKDPSICKTAVYQFLTPREMVRIEAVDPVLNRF
nr:hypothetical protein [Tanacetum cinerariifolium]